MNMILTTEFAKINKVLVTQFNRNFTTESQDNYTSKLEYNVVTKKG